MKTTDEIYAQMKDTFEQRTGRKIANDCDMAVRMYAVAAELEALYAYNEWIKNQCFPQTATGEHLTRHAQMRGITRTPAAKAVGAIRFYINSERATDVEIPAGTVCMTEEDVHFVTAEAAVITAGTLYAEAPAEAMEAGAKGNALPGSIIYMSPAPTGVAGCSNTEAFAGGADEEDDESLRARVLTSYKHLSTGANKAYYESAVSAVPGVGAVTVLPKNRGLGTVDVIIASETGMPSDELIAEVQAKLDEAREICVDIEVSAPTGTDIPVECAVTPEEGYAFDDVAENVQEAINAYFNGGLLGKRVTRATVGNIIYSVPGVANYELTEPHTDLTATEGVLPVCSGVTVNEL